MLHIHSLHFPNPVLQADLISTAVGVGFQGCTTTATPSPAGWISMVTPASKHPHQPGWLRTRDLMCLKLRMFCKIKQNKTKQNISRRKIKNMLYRIMLGFYNKCLETIQRDKDIDYLPSFVWVCTTQWQYSNDNKHPISVYVKNHQVF